jgi:hypothetical protein
MWCTASAFNPAEIRLKVACWLAIRLYTNCSEAPKARKTAWFVPKFGMQTRPLSDSLGSFGEFPIWPGKDPADGHVKMSGVALGHYD